ncbi:hypothetical protein LCGC14_1477200 [marine sediment metagenome]|uniref:HTH dtxR-type domain-containing protein n=1 Tax=marine sediment metagenome TaxID=412755 RepID=A0A0F9JAM9_9ZZZZ
MAKQGPKLTRRLEDYLEAVLVLIRESGAARVRDIAARTDVSMPSVTAALKQLARMGLVHYDPYELVTITPRGEKAGAKICAKHEALVDFMVKVLDVDVEQAGANACRIEHVMDDHVLGRLSLLGNYLLVRGGDEQWLEEFRSCCRREMPAAPGLAGGEDDAERESPMSSSDPNRNGLPAMPLATALVGQTVTFASARGGAKMVRRLAEMGLTPGEPFEVINRGPGPFIVTVKGTKLVLGRGMVHRILVRPV